ncbi:DNA methyltransferase [Iningainema tapete]|uniref:site-specific DNA-methyltransferase (cytosine-N(4)-specific) n=1 Tax=Iningainema tapete BLCC-T55 TaxID=2748662 RepID=A0A8J6XFG0_9CYAN|nr:DNA methyltransferase [Iningainema tapete]MBD2775655.1 SAM-dependent methyltransferase [Iningainema tapete BLCC-T55]
MKAQQSIGLYNHLTHKGNLKHTRYGWLRLTPAYSVHLVSDLLDTYKDKNPVVLDPFCGTGTTVLVCAERGIESDTIDINPFLVWLTRAKTRSYKQEEIVNFEKASNLVVENMLTTEEIVAWIPPLHQIEKWWDKKTLLSLSHAMRVINEAEKSISESVADLLKVTFCRVMIERANVSFGHQSMSFKKNGNSNLPLLQLLEDETILIWKQATSTISQAAKSKIISHPRVFLCDARNLSVKLEPNRYTCVITSPPYPNRMSYIRELRPYMYWLGYLQNGRDAGELDWKAIGGTWGCATSNVGKWKPEYDLKISYDGFYTILDNIAQTSELLSRYVHKYFYDMVQHSKEIFKVVKPGGFIHYIVGNSKFYDVMLPVECIFASIFESVGFVNINIRTIRKRTSKKELFEFIVSAQKPN